MRTRNRNLRDLLTDEEQLNRYGLPVWKTEEDVAKAIGISLKELWFFAIHRERERQPHYVTFAIPKRSGGKRLIMAPKRRLKAIQRKLLELLVGKLPLSEHAHAFRRGRSIRTGAEPHVGKRFVLKLDLKDFFPFGYFRTRPRALDRLRLQLSGCNDPRGGDDRGGTTTGRSRWHSVSRAGRPASLCPRCSDQPGDMQCTTAPPRPSSGWPGEKAWIGLHTLRRRSNVFRRGGSNHRPQVPMYREPNRF